jgi:hypothetical protein
VRGLVPYFHENECLQDDLLVGLFKNLMHLVWLRSIRHEQSDTSRLMVSEVVRAFADFLDEVSSVASTGIRSDAFTVIIEGQQKEALEALGKIKYIASLQEAMTESNYVRKGQNIPSTGVGNCWTYQNDCALQHRFQLPWDLSGIFYSIVRCII